MGKNWQQNGGRSVSEAKNPRKLEGSYGPDRGGKKKTIDHQNLREHSAIASLMIVVREI